MKVRGPESLSLEVKSLSIRFYAALTFCAVCCAYWLVQSYFFSPHDFANSYFAAYFFLRGEFNSAVLDPLTFNRMIYDEGFRNIFAAFNPNPPLISLLFVPFALLPLPVAKVLFGTLSCVLFMISLCRICNHHGVKPAIILVATPILFFTPFRNQILFGQTYFLVFFLLVEGYLAYRQNRSWLVALSWGLAIVIKVFPAIVIFFLVLRKEWRHLFMLFAACLAFLCVAVAIQGVDVWETYLLQVLPRSGRGEITGAYVANYQSALMFFKYAFVGEPTLNPAPFIQNESLFIVALIVFNTLVLSACASIILDKKDLCAFSALLVASLLITPYGNTYGLLLLLPALIFVYTNESQWQWWGVALFCFTMANLPVGWFNDLPPLMRFPRLALLIILLTFMVLKYGARINWQIIVTLFGALTLASLPKEKNTGTPGTLLPGQQHSLIVDYSIRDGMLAYQYWSDHGEQTFQTDVAATSLATGAIGLRENQIWYEGARITDTPDRKLKPAILDNRTIIYLSDLGRGYGFYNLRMISIENKIHEER